MLAGSIHISHNRNVFKKPVENTMKILCAIEPVCKNVSLKLFYTNGTDCFILASLQNEFFDALCFSLSPATLCRGCFVTTKIISV